MLHPFEKSRPVSGKSGMSSAKIAYKAGANSSGIFSQSFEERIC